MPTNNDHLKHSFNHLSKNFDGYDASEGFGIQKEVVGRAKRKHKGVSAASEDAPKRS
jgi:hypothetical protein